MGRLLHDWGRNRNDGGGFFIAGAYYTFAGGELFSCKKSPGETFACKNPPRGRIFTGKIPPAGGDLGGRTYNGTPASRNHQKCRVADRR